MELECQMHRWFPTPVCELRFIHSEVSAGQQRNEEKKNVVFNLFFLSDYALF